MKKIKVFLVGLMTVILSLFCLVGCFKSGRYEAVAYKAGPITIDITAEHEEDVSFVELNFDKTANVSINIAIGKIEGSGTWENGEGENEVVITIEERKYTATVEDGKLIVEIFGTQIIFEK